MSHIRRQKRRRWWDCFEKAPQIESTDRHREDRILRQGSLEANLQQQYNQLEIIEEAPEETIKINTNYEVSDILVLDETPQTFKEQALYRYNCPVCLRYFSIILVGKWWGNYLCHFWADDFVQMDMKKPEFGVKWPLWGKPELDLEDVDPEKEVRNYGDSFVTAKDPNKQTTAIEESKMVQNEINNPSERQLDVDNFVKTDSNIIQEKDSMRFTVLSNMSSYFF